MNQKYSILNTLLSIKDCHGTKPTISKIQYHKSVIRIKSKNKKSTRNKSKGT